MTLTVEKILEMGDSAAVSNAAGPDHLWRGNRLPPRQWEALRIELQRRYRRATGEEFAVLSVDAPGAWP